MAPFHALDGGSAWDWHIIVLTCSHEPVGLSFGMFLHFALPYRQNYVPLAAHALAPRPVPVNEQNRGILRMWFRSSLETS